jgi:hypothetical protein
MVQERSKSSKMEGEIPGTLCVLNILHTADVQHIIKEAVKPSTSNVLRGTL